MPDPAVVVQGATVTYAGASRPALLDVDLEIDEGELALVVGRTGSGKSTLLGLVNGAVPHFTGGRLHGRVRLLGRDTATHRPRDLAGLVGVVGQDPLAGFVTDTVEEELAYGMEQLALPGDVMRRRVEEALDLLGIAELRDAPLRELSGGQQQRVAIGSVLTAHPQVLVLDEPTSALDPTGAEEVLAAVTRLVHDLGVTVVLAEHRIERVIQYADLVVHVGPEGRVRSGSPAEMMATSSVAPPVVELGRWAGWSPLPLSVRDARRAAHALREAAAGPASAGPGPGSHSAVACPVASPARAGAATGTAEVPATPGATRGAILEARGIVVRHGDVVAVAGADLSLAPGEIVALMGRNGSGKTSLLWALQGSGRRQGGKVRVPAGAADRPGSRLGSRPGSGPEDHPVDPRDMAPDRRRRLVGLVPQSPGDLLYLESVAHECAQADHECAATPGTCAGLLAAIAPGIPADRHPADLSEGQRLALVLAVQLTADPPVLLLDEPTRGLDYDAKRALAAVLRSLAERGRSIVASTHDVEFVAGLAERVVVLAGGEVVADGPTADVVRSSPAFAPQVAKITAPSPWLTVADVEAALPDGPPR
jgi:energy-coupling factor transport system ATP-binding protein